MTRWARVRWSVLVPAVAACFGWGAGSAGAAVGGPICNVPTDYGTIQAAVNDSGCTTIDVAAGTYNEQVQITRTLTLNGAQAGVDARTRSGPESIITNSCGPVQIMADNVKIDGFTIEGSTMSDPCYLAGIWSNPSFSGTHGGFTIVNNIIQNNIAGIELDSDGTNPTVVQHNLIQNNNNPGPGSGNGIETSFGLANATIDANKFSGDASSSMVVDDFSGTDQNLSLTNNTLVGGTPEGFALIDVSNTTISGNTSVGSTSSATIDLFGADSNITVSSNVLANGVRGIQVENPYGAQFSVAPNSGINAQSNCIAGNSSAGLEEDSGGYAPPVPALDATNNWWGSPSGPTIASNPGGTGDKIIDQDGVVSYKPFATSPNGAGCPPPPCPQGTKANFRWHYSANGSAGGWSGTKTAVCPASLTMGPQAMEGDLKVTHGTTLKAGYDFSIPGNKSTVPLTVSKPKVVFTLRCVSGAPASPNMLTVTMPDASYSVTNSNWYPSADQQSILVYQGSATVPNACGGGQVRLDQGGTFTAGVG